MLRFIKNIIAAIAILCCSQARAWDSDSIAAMFAHRELDSIEGVWQFPPDGAVILITRSSAATFDMTLLDSPRLDLRPGTSIGTIIKAPDANKYRAEFNSRALAEKKLKKSKAVITVTASDMLKFEPFSENLKVSFYRLIPYFLRVSVSREKNVPNSLTGAIRLYPKTAKTRKPCL